MFDICEYSYISEASTKSSIANIIIKLYEQIGTSCMYVPMYIYIQKKMYMKNQQQNDRVVIYQTSKNQKVQISGGNEEI